MHGSNGPRSSEHSKSAPSTFASKSMTAVLLVLGPPSGGSNGVSGGVKPGPEVNMVMIPSSRQVYVSGLADVALPVGRADVERVQAELGVLERDLPAGERHRDDALVEAARLVREEREVDGALEE